jgi:hypothetical protein
MAYSTYYLNQRLSNLQYQVNQISNPSTGYVPIQGNIIINGIKDFAQFPPKSAILPVNPNDLTNKTYVDSLIPTPLDPVVLIDGNQTLGSGIKTFINLPQSNTIPLNNDDFTNKLYVDLNSITLNDVLSNTLPFTALQTFNAGLIVNKVMSTFNKLLIANSGIQTNSIQSNGALNITNTVAESTNINTSLNVLGAAIFLSTLTTENITGGDITINSNSLTTNTTLIMQELLYIVPTAGANFGDNFAGSTNNGNTLLTQTTGRFQIKNVSNSLQTGHPSDILIF